MSLLARILHRRKEPVLTEAEFNQLLEGAFVGVSDLRPTIFVSETAFEFWKNHSPLPVKGWPFNPLITTDLVYRKAVLSGHLAAL